MTPLAIYYEHPRWFEALFKELERRRIPWTGIKIQEHILDPTELIIPAPVIFNRLAMSSFLRQAEHATFHVLSAVYHWERAGARVINGSQALYIDTSKSRQLSLFRSLGMAVPRTRAVHRREDIARAAAEIGYPLVVKPNIGGSGSGVMRFNSSVELGEALENGSLTLGVDGAALVQDYVPARNGQVVRCETLNGRFLYAIALNGAGSTFDLCPADICLADKPTITIERFQPTPEIIAAVEAVARAAHLDVGGIEYLVDDRDGVPKFYDLNALSNFVANPLDVLGWDPHEKLVDFLVETIGEKRFAA